MFYPVKVIDNEGTLIKTVNSKELSQRYWKTFYQDISEENTSKLSKVKHQKKGNNKFDVTNIIISSN